MAERRMFHTSVVESDAFLELPIGAQALYFHLGMHADDDGFVNNPKQITRKLGRRSKELQLLIDTGFLLEFNGIIVIKHWRMANILRTDRMKPLRYPYIAAKLYATANREYSLQPQDFSPTLLELRQQILTTNCPPKIREDNIREDNISQDNISQDSIGSAGDAPFTDTLAYIRSLREHPLAERSDP